MKRRDARLVVFVGSGGVGKTTLAAGSALSAAREGEDVLVMTFDPSKRLEDMLGVAGKSGDRTVRVPTTATGLVEASLLDAGATFDRIVERYAPDEPSRDRILGNRFYRHLSGGLAGVLEYMAVERLYEVLEEDRHDRIVLDTPPTREAIDLLGAPGRIVGFLESGAAEVAKRSWFDEKGRLRVTRKLGRIGRGLEELLDRAVGLDLLREVAEFFQAFGPLYDGFRQRAEEVEAMLRSPRTSFVLVTGPRPDGIPATTFFARRLIEEGHHLAAVAVNRVHPMPEGAFEKGQETGDGRLLLRWLATEDRRGIEDLRDRMSGGPPVVEIPLQGDAPASASDVETLGATLAAAFRGAGIAAP
jgi:anion-transporting  ArsA/GET3 family ATPase